MKSKTAQGEPKTYPGRIIGEDAISREGVGAGHVGHVDGGGEVILGAEQGGDQARVQGDLTR